MSPPASGPKYAPVRFRLVALLLVFALLALSIPQGFIPIIQTTEAAGTVNLATLDVAYTQNFDTLASSGTSSSVPTGWDFSESGPNANTPSTAGPGSGNAGDTYSFGASASSERAFGQLRSGSLISTLGGSFTNNTGWTLTSLDVAYIGEQWLLGATGRNDRMDFQYSTNATSLTTGTWTAVTALNFTGPVSAGTVGLLDGNAAANRVAVSSTVTGLSIANGATFWIRWTDLDASGADDGLAVDNFSLTPHGVVQPTNPTGVGAANPSSVAPTETSLLTVTVTPGANPTSTAHTVTADLSSIGGPASQQFFDDGSTGGDATANDNVFSYLATVAAGTTGGTKTLPFAIQETAPNSRTGSGNISLTVLTPTNPSGTGTANPPSVLPGASSLLTVNVTPGANPASTGLAVTADLSSIGGSAAQTFSGSGNTFTYTATVSGDTNPGVKTLPFTVTDTQARSGGGNITLTVNAPPTPAAVVISQVYGGGGNTGATLKNDYIELVNHSGAPVNLSGWSVQAFVSTTGTWQMTPLTNFTLQPGQYYLVQESQGEGGTDGLPTPDAVGTIPVSSTSTKVALVSNTTTLTRVCPNTTAAGIVDLVGYGSTNCFEGSGTAPTLTNTTAALRLGDGCFDTDDNAHDFTDQKST